MLRRWTACFVCVAAAAAVFGMAAMAMNVASFGAFSGEMVRSGDPVDAGFLCLLGCITAIAGAFLITGDKA